MPTGAGKNCYFIIFSLRTCLGCARNASCSVRPVGPGPSWTAPGAPAKGGTPVVALNCKQIPKSHFCHSGAQNGAFGTKKASLEASVMDLCTPKKLRGLCACELLFCPNEWRKITKMLIFTICWRDGHTDRGQRGPAGPPLPREKKLARGRCCASPHSNKVTVARRRRKKLLLHHFQPPHLPGMCQGRIFLVAFLEHSGL